MADLDEAAGQHVEEEAPDELDGIQGHFLDLVMVFGIPPTEPHAASLHIEQSSIGDGDAMGVTRQVAKHLLRAAEGRLDVGDPVLLFQRFNPIFESDRMGQFAKGPVQAQFPCGEGLL